MPDCHWSRADRLLPTETQTWLLQACLWSGEPGRRAWEMWQQSIGEPIHFFTHDETGSNALLPLLFVALRDNHAAVDAAFQTPAQNGVYER